MAKWQNGEEETLLERFFYKPEIGNLNQIIGGFLKILDGMINILTLGFRGGGFFVEYTFWRKTWGRELKRARKVAFPKFNLRPTPLTKEEQLEAKQQLEIDEKGE